MNEDSINGGGVGRNPEQNERARDQRREQIMEVALGLFATRGLGSTKISDIARGAKISQGLLYHYFDSKEAIYVALIREAFERMNQAARDLAGTTMTPREKIESAIEQLLAEVEENERFAHHVLLIAQAGISDGLPAGAPELIGRHQDVPYRVVAGILAEGQAAGVVRDHDAADLSVLFWSIIRGLALYRATRGRVFDRGGAELLKSVFLKDGE
jgi:TetR/AcrR family transcriptional regulator